MFSVLGKKVAASSRASDQAVNPFVSRAFMVLLVAAVFFFGAPFLQGLLRERTEGKASLGWPQTEGEITKCEYRKGRRDSFYATIAYHYNINGREYFSERLTVSENSFRRDVRKLVQEHSAGSKIPVYYDARNPSSSVLIRGIDSEDTFVLMFFFGMALLLVGCCVAIIIQTLRELIVRRKIQLHA